MELTVGTALAGERVDRAVALLCGCTRAAASALVEGGGLRIGGSVVTSRHRRVLAGEVLELEAPPAPPGPAVTEPEEGVEFRLVHVDEAIIVVDKPAGLVVHPGAGNPRGTLVAGLLARFPELGTRSLGEPSRPGLVHRLDKQTSGLLVVARTARAYESLVGQLARREVRRVYEALVLGRLDADAGVIDAPIGRSSRDRTRMAVEHAGRAARTHYVVRERLVGDAALTLVEARLETGRTHQIRVHFAAIGHPVAGDRTYRGAQVAGLGRTFLHAGALGFTHPLSGEPVGYESPLPDELRAVLAGLEREGAPG